MRNSQSRFSKLLSKHLTGDSVEMLLCGMSLFNCNKVNSKSTADFFGQPADGQGHSLANPWLSLDETG